MGPVKQEQDKINHKRNSVPEQVGEKLSQESVLRKLDKYVEESSSSLVKEDDTEKDYKRMYWDLVDNLKKIVHAADGI